MKREPEIVSEADLHAYVDGRLDETRRETVERYLAENPDTAQRVHDYQSINRSLHALFDDALDEPIPPRLQLRHRSSRLRLLRVAGAAGWLLLGGVLGWLAHYQTAPVSSESPPLAANLVAEALSAHTVYTPEVRHPVEVEASQEQHLVTWLSKRLQANIRAPHLQSLGFALLGGRLLAADEGPAAQFMYENNAGRRLTLFVRKGTVHNRDTAFRFAEKNGVRAFYWIDRDLGYALLGDLDKTTLADLANSVYQQLNP